MKRRTFNRKQVYLGFAVWIALCFSASLSFAAIIADHQAARDFSSIPESYFSQARSTFHIYYGHTSHGSQVVEGMNMLENENSSRYALPPLYDDYDIDLGYPEWITKTRDYLNEHPETNLVMWSWCGQASWISSEEVDDYLASMAQFESEYPNVTFVYMTGHLDGEGPSGTLYANNNRIRSYCTANNKVLFDFADIESYDPDGNYYPNESDGCDWCATWCASHDCPTCGDCAHSRCFNCYQKGKAFWWLLARLSGWLGDGDDPVTTTTVSVTTTTTTAISTTTLPLVVTTTTPIIATTTVPANPGAQQDYHVQQNVGNDANTGGGWGTGQALATIQRAVDMAQSDGKTSAIYVAEGTYSENLVINAAESLSLYGGYAGEGSGARNTGAYPSIIDGHKAGRVIEISSGSKITIDGFVIQNGKIEGSGAGMHIGGASAVIIRGNTIRDNQATNDWGGGIAVVQADVMITNNTIQNNTTTGSGGGISFYGDEWGACSGTVTGNTITGNGAHDNGAGIHMHNAALVITDNDITNNTVAADGGGISSYDCSSLRISGNRISGNTAGYDGGGFLYQNSSAEISRNLIQNNTCQNWGGGICIYSSAGTISNNVIYKNSAGAVGGGISYFDGSSTVVINNTIVGNSAESTGGGIGCYANSTAGVVNTIVWGNSPDQVDRDSESTLYVTYSNVQGGYSGAGNIDADPDFISTNPYDFHLQSGSSCIGAGTASSGVSELPTDDFEGNSRPNPGGTSPDIGAYEASGTGYLVDADLWIHAVINTEEKGKVDALWKKGGEGETAAGDKVIWGYFYANPNDVTWGSPDNPDLFVKIWSDHGGRLDVNFFHVSVPDIIVYSEYPYDGTSDEEGATTMARRYIRHYYENAQSFSSEQNEDGSPPSGYSPANNPTGTSTINNLRIGAMINTVEKGSVEAVWQLGGQGSTPRGDEVVWGHIYANPSDVTWGDMNNPDLFVKIWFDAGGRVDVNFFHVSVPDIEVYSALPDDGSYDQMGTSIMDNRYVRHEYQP